MQLDVSIFTPQDLIFHKKVKRLVLPGESGVFEILPFHKSLLSRLVSGTLIADEKHIALKRGVVKVSNNNVTVIIEQK